MNNKLYVGNLSFQANEEDIHQLFADCGNVQSVKLITDRETGRSKGFAFVEMSTDAEAESAITKLNSTQQFGRDINVTIARPMEKKDNRNNNFKRNRY